MSTRARRLLTVFALLGLVASAVSTLVHYRLLRQPGYVASFCDISAWVSCTSAYLSRFGSVAGVPVALVGLLWFALVLLLLWAARRGTRPTAENIAGYLFAMSTLALAAVLYLGYASLFVLKTVCLLCLGTYLAAAGLFVVSGAVSSQPMMTLPRRAFRDVRTVLKTPVALVVALVFLVAASAVLAAFPRERTAASDASAQRNEGAEFARWYAQQPRVQVPVPVPDGATVLIVKFNDYQCPPCRQTFLNYKSVLAKFEAERPGAVRVVSRDFPLETECNAGVTKDVHPAACEAAVAMRLARGKQQADKLEDWLFANQATMSAALVRTGVRDVAGVTDFDAQYGAALEQVKADVALGRLLGVSSTPTFFINGVKVVGGLPPQYFQQAIEFELGKASKP